MIPTEAALDALERLADAGRAEQLAAHMQVPRRYLGVPVPQVTDLATEWRAQLDIDGRVALARDLWASDIHEARIAAAKLLTQARIRPDTAVWELFLSWLPDFDGWALADHACDVGRRRLEAVPERIETVESWTRSPHVWTRRAALVVTLPYAHKNFPKAQDSAIRERVLGWAAGYVSDPDRFIQKAVAWWLSDLSKHDPARARAFLEGPGAGLKPFARKEAARHLTGG